MKDSIANSYFWRVMAVAAVVAIFTLAASIQSRSAQPERGSLFTSEAQADTPTGWMTRAAISGSDVDGISEPLTSDQGTLMRLDNGGALFVIRSQTFDEIAWFSFNSDGTVNDGAISDASNRPLRIEDEKQ